MSTEQFDVAVVGGGHNGLVAATYLARGGQRVVVLEQRANLGGACATEELFPGYRISSCSYQLYMFQDRVMQDLRLVENGLRILPVDPVLHLFPDRSVLRSWRDSEKTAAEIAAMAPEDVQGFKKWNHFWDAAGSLFEKHMLEHDTPTIEDLHSQADPDTQAMLDRLHKGTVRELLNECFVNEKTKAFALLGIGPTTSVDSPGSLLSAAAQEAVGRTGSPEYKGLPVGGMGSVADGIAKAAQAAGVIIEAGSPVTRIIVQDGRASGVELSDGRTIQTRAVISNATPQVTFTTLLDSGAPQASGVDRAMSKIESTFHSMKFHATVTELPDLRAWLGDDADLRQLANIRLSPSVEHFAAAHDDAAAGRLVQNPVVHVQIPTVLDTTVAPPGRHIVSMWVRFAPRKPPSGTWEDVREAEAQRLIDLFTSYAPNFKQSITDYVLFTPDDLEERIGMTAGNINHMDQVVGQMLGDRLFAGGGHRTPVAGLYMCGAGTHPGGSVTGAPGYNAAQVVIADLP